MIKYLKRHSSITLPIDEMIYLHSDSMFNSFGSEKAVKVLFDYLESLGLKIDYFNAEVDLANGVELYHIVFSSGEDLLKLSLLYGDDEISLFKDAINYER